MKKLEIKKLNVKPLSSKELLKVKGGNSDTRVIVVDIVMN